MSSEPRSPEDVDVQTISDEMAVLMRDFRLLLARPLGDEELEQLNMTTSDLAAWLSRVRTLDGEQSVRAVTTAQMAAELEDWLRQNKESDPASPGGPMTAASDAPLDLYIAAYDDPDAAQSDWDAIQQLAKDKAITVDGLVLVSRGMDGKIEVKDIFHTVGGGALGATGALLVGLIFPHALLASRVGAGVGGLVSHSEKKEIKAEVADGLPPGSSGIVVLFEETFAADIAKSLPNADNVSKHEVDREPRQAKAGPARAAADPVITKVTVNLPTEMVAQLKRLGVEEGKTFTQVLKEAISLSLFADETLRGGGKLLVEHPDKTIERIVFR